jgi:hypothetical protein
VAGYYEQTDRSLISYNVPTNPKSWPLVFFVSGTVTRDPGTGEITDLQAGEVPSQRETEFKNIILRIKPLHSWAGLIINYV